jgi:glycosyltransferase involved in cell wall biosynthesis
VLHVITRMIVGGAQENTMLSCALMDRERFTSEIVCGPETGAQGSLHDACRARGVSLFVEPALVRRPQPALDALVLLRLAARMRRGRYDVVHTHSSKAGIVGRIAARLAGTPVVVHTAHGWAFSREDPPRTRAMWIQLERFCARLCHSIVVVAKADRERGLGAGVGRPAQYELIRSGIEVERYRDTPVDRAEARARIGVPDRAFVVGSVAQLNRQKSPLDLVAGFARLAASRPDAHLVLVGDGPDRAQVERGVARAGLAERVHLLGQRMDVPQILPAFDVFALASRWEGLPRVFPQAMAAGLPVVATRVDGAPDAITPGENGWLVDVGDAETLGARLLELATDPKLAREMGERGRARVEEFSARRMVEQLAALYTRLVEARGRSTR